MESKTHNNLEDYLIEFIKEFETQRISKPITVKDFLDKFCYHNSLSVKKLNPIEIWNKAKELNGIDFTTWINKNSQPTPN